MRGVRLILLLDAVAVGAVAGGLLLLGGLPPAAAGTLGPRRLVLLVTAAVAVAVAVGAALLFRAVARPVDRMVGAAERLAGAGHLPSLQAPGLADGGLQAGAVAFERLAGALATEQARLAAKVAELEAASTRLAQAREDLLRSERLATVGRLAAGLAHEIGNPLGAIAGYVEIARVRLPANADPDLTEAVGRIAEAAARIDRTIRDLLDLARPAPARLASLDLGAELATAVRLARVQERFRQVEVETRLAPGLPPVLADGHQLGQVLLNLLLNAGDAMRGQGRVVLSAGSAEGGAAVELSVADAGPGILPEHLPRLFEPFFTTKEPGEGTGLGLAISHRIVESLGGALAAENGAGGGAVFRVRLPARRSAQVGGELEPEGDPLAPPRARPLK
jgi:signal transduction histidine kinase